MKSAVTDIMPPKLRRSLAKFGRDISLARKKRRLTVQMMTDRLGVAKPTYLRIEKGDPSVSMGAYAMALFALGFADGFETLADQAGDDQGLLLDAERIPKRVRVPKKATSL